MRTVAKEKTSPVVSESGAAAVSENGNNGSWFRTHWCLISLFVIIAVAFILRFAFAYGVSAGDNYALSGGSSASSHLRIVTEILAGTYDPANQATINFPYGSGSISGPLFDYLMAAIAYVVTLCGVSQATAAAGTLAWSAPIIGALTCFPVYLIGKKLLKDELVGLLAAVFYALFPLMIMTTAFSNGTENAFTCFLMAWFVYFVIRTLEASDAVEITGFKQLFSNEPLRTNMFISAVLMAFLVLTWTGFWAIIACAAAIMFVTLLFRRIGRKDLLATVLIGNFIVLVGVGIGAIYYIPLGLWSTVFQGGCLLAVLVAAYSVLFLLLEKQPWVLSIPLTLAVIIAVAAVLAVFAPSVSSALLHGSSPQVGALANDLAHQFSRTSISSMASYYGWLTVWFPMFLGVWMAYKYRANAKYNLYTFVMLWLFCCFFIGWFSAEYAIVAGAGFAVGSAALIVMVFRAVDLKAYLKSLRGLGVKGGLRKALDFFPLVTLLVAVCLIAAPAAVYAADAATPTNNEHSNYFGGLGYTVNTTDSSMVNAAWESYSSQAKSGALMSWYGYSDAASSVGGFSTVTSSVGGGTSAMASAYLSAGSSGAIASFIIRLAESNPDADSSAFTAAGVPDPAKYIKNPADARAYMSANVDKFVAYNANVHDESLPYIVGVSYLTEKLSENQLAGLYNTVCGISGNTISYIAVDGSMLPTYYNDGSYTSTIGYYADRLSTDYNGIANLYEVSSTTQMYYQYGGLGQLYYNYLDGMYETFLWNALLGVTPAQYGLTNATAGSSNLSLFEALGNSDGTVKAQPAAGMGDFTVSYWHVKYRANESADWVDMDAQAAIQKQAAEGGYINYLSSVVVLEYNSSARTVMNGTIVSSATFSNVKVAVFEKDETASGATNYIQRSTVLVSTAGDATSADFSISVPASGEYLVRYYLGAKGIRDGTLYHTEVNTVPTNFDLGSATVNGTVVSGVDGSAYGDVTLTFTSSNGSVKSTTANASGVFTISLVPDVYTVTVYSTSKVVMSTTTLPVVGNTSTDNLRISAGAREVTVTLTDVFGNPVSGNVDVTFLDNNGTKTFKTITDGSASVYLNNEDYVVFVDTATKISLQSKALSKETDSISFVVYDATSLGASAGNVVAMLGYTNVAASTSVNVPSSLSALLAVYDATGTAVSGTVKVGSAGVTATVAFIDGSGKTYLLASDANGAFSGALTAGDYTVYAYDGNGHAFIGTMTAGENMEIALVDSFDATANVNCSVNGTRNMGAVPLTFTVTPGADSFTLPAATDDSGSYVLHVPSSATVSYTVKKADMDSSYGAIFSIGGDYTSGPVGSGSSLEAFTISKASKTPTAPCVNAVDKGLVTFPGFSGELKLSGPADYTATVSSGTITDLAGYSTDSILPGSYTVTNKSDNVFMKSTSVTIYPTATTVELEFSEGFMIELTKNTGDSVSVMKVSDDGDYTSDLSGTPYKYWFKKDGTNLEYYFKITNGDKIWYSDRYTSGGTISGYTVEDTKVTVTGYVGAKVSGTVTVTYDTVNVKATLNQGEYSVDLPSGKTVVVSVKTETTNGGYKYAFDGPISGPVTISEENKVINGAIDVTRTSDASIVTVSSATFADGVGNVTVTVENKNDYPVVYFIAGSDAFILNETYMVEIDANSTSSAVPIVGYYNHHTVGAGNEDVAVTVTDTAGKTVATRILGEDATWSSTGGEATVKLAGTDKITDAVDGYSYKYAVAIHNTDAAFKSVNITAAIVGDATGWSINITDTSGYYVKGDSVTNWKANGLNDTIFYVMLSKADGTGMNATVPSISVTVSGNATLATTTLDPAIGTLKESDVTVTGADDKKAGLAPAFWIFTVLTILMFLVLLWAGMKRGVFSRRN